MINCNIEEPIAKFQHKKKQYVICPIFDGESLLAYWYCVLSKETYDTLQQSESMNVFEKFEQELLNVAIDIRKLPNYKKLSISQILFHRKELIVPLIKESIKTELIII